MTSLHPSSGYSPRTSSSSASTRSSIGTYSIQLLNAIPGTLPRSTKPTPERLSLVANVLSVHLSEHELPHAFLGRFALLLRGAAYQPRWIDLDVSRPTLGGTQRVKEVISAHPDFAIHNEAREGMVERLLVTHKCGIYLRLSVGAISHLRKKIFKISVPTTHSQAVLPLLTPARQFLETVIVAASEDGRPEDAEDLLWMYDHLRIELLNDTNTLKKTWDQGRLQRVVNLFPMVGEVVLNLGLGVQGDRDESASATITDTASIARSSMSY